MAYPQSPQLHEFWTELTTWLPIKVKENSRDDDDAYVDWASTQWAQQQVVANTSYWSTRRGQAAADGPASVIRDYSADVAIDASDAMMASMIDKSKPITTLKDMEVGKMYAANMTEGMVDEGKPVPPQWAIMTITSKARKYAEIVGIKTSLENITPPGWDGTVKDYYEGLLRFYNAYNWEWVKDKDGDQVRDYVFTLAKYQKKYEAYAKRNPQDDDAQEKTSEQAARDALNDTFKNLDQISGYPFPDLDQRGVRQWIETGISPFSLLKVDMWVDSPNETYKKDRRVDPFNVQPGGSYYNRPPRVSTWYPVRSGGPTKKQKRKPFYSGISRIGFINWNLQDPENL